MTGAASLCPDGSPASEAFKVLVRPVCFFKRLSETAIEFRMCNYVKIKEDPNRLLYFCNKLAETGRATSAAGAPAKEGRAVSHRESTASIELNRFW